MKRCLTILALLILGIQMVSLAQEWEVPEGLRNNFYYTESLRFNNLARVALNEGNYEVSREHSEEAIRFANLSDEYVYMRMRMWETDQVIATAAARLQFAESVDAETRFPAEFGRAQAAMGEARAYRNDQMWDDAIDAANSVLALLAFIDAGDRIGEPGMAPLPSQYTVRTWEGQRDCLWNIAGRPWVYNNPWEWRRLYDANRSKLPESDNPDLIEPGIVLDIPSIRGEHRQGMWDSAALYPGL
ncbi:MAG: LysM peptidoglycan-binding domain-containing protein [Treponema sp.]|nr:LysM peptidoglycan-binding domain-containing protein [Treponema sp.]